MLARFIIWHRTTGAAGVSIFGQRRGHEEMGELRPTQSIRVVKVTLIHVVSTAALWRTPQPAVITVQLTLAVAIPF